MMGLRMKNFNILGVHWKIRFLGGGGLLKTNIEGGRVCLKRGGGVGQFAYLGGGVGWQERGGGVSEGGDTQCTLC